MRGNCPQFSKNARGFTLVEFAAVMVVAGFILVMFMDLYRLYIMDKDQKETFEKIQAINSSMVKYYGATRKYPCPSDRSLPPSDANYGRSDCALALTAGTCNASGGLCKADGRTTGIGAGAPGPDPVIIGGIPFITISETLGASMTTEDVNFDQTIDAWANQFTYAVSRTLTDAFSFNEALGAIGLVKEDGVSLIEPVDSSHYVVVSHGKNKAGAFTADGVISVPCTDGSPLEQENCDNDGTFMSALFSGAVGPDYNDDLAFSHAWALSSLWDVAANGVDIYNRNPGNVGVGTATPMEKLDVIGTLKGATIKSDWICDKATGTECFQPEDLGGNTSTTGMDCKDVPTSAGKFRVLQGIAYRDPECSAELNLPTAISSQNCTAPGEFVQGIDAAGNVICGAL